MKKSQRILVVVNLAVRAEEEAANACEAARREWDLEVQKHQELSNYYSDYEARSKKLTQGRRAQEIITERNFLRNMADAVTGQGMMADNAKLRYEELKQRYLEAHLKRQAFEGLVEKYKGEEQLILNKQEQKMLDDWVSQIHGRRR